MPVDHSGPSRLSTEIERHMPNVEFRRIRAEEDYRQVIDLRRRAYGERDMLASGMVPPSFDKYDLLENTQCFGLFLEGSLVSSMRLHHMCASTPWGPSLEMFPDSPLKHEIFESRGLIEGARFCIGMEPVSVPRNVLRFLTLRLVFMAAQHFHASYNISVTRVEHGSFYRRYFGSERWDEATTTLSWFKHPLALFSCDMDRNEALIETRMPFMKSSFEERAALFSDTLAEQGVNQVKGMFGNLATNAGRPRTQPPMAEIAARLA